MPAYSLNEYMNLPQSDTVWIWKGLIPLGGSIALFGNPKVGKALGLDTPMLTPTGWTTLRDIHPGSLIYTASGHPTRVVAESEVFPNRPCFKVEFQSGESLIADEEHLWKVSTTRDRKGERLLTTKDLVTRGINIFEGGSKYRRDVWHVELPSGALEFPAPQELPNIDPYVLGAWLGDGTANSQYITTADKEMLDIIESKGYVTHKVPSTKYGYGIRDKRDSTSILLRLRAMELLENKHIPSDYLYGSVEDRKELLAGLLDTDGWPNGGTAYFYNTNELLAKQVYELAISLGLKVVISDKRATLYGKDCGICWIVAIRAPYNVFKLKRKAALFKENVETYLTVTSIEPVEPQETKCVQVDDKSGMFLAGRGCIPTHNSKIALGIAEAVADSSIEEFLGQEIQTHGRVLYIQLDTPRTLWTSGYVSVVTSEEAKNNIYIIDREMEDLPKQFDIRGATCMTWLRHEVDRIEPILVIIDTIRRMHRGKENDSDDMAIVVDSFYYACAPAALMFLAHKKKAQTGETGNGTVRGSTAFSGAVDALINMSKSKLAIEARSDVDEEIPIYQLDNGMWSRNSEEEAIKKYLAEIPGGIANAKQDEMIAARFTVSTRTARRWRTSLTGKDNG